MLLPIRPICNRKKIRKDGTSLIQIQYCFSAEKKTLLNTGIAIPSNFWTKKSLCISDKLPASYGTAQILNSKLKDMLRIAEDIVEHAIKNKICDPVAFTKETFNPNFDVSTLGKQPTTSVKKKSGVNLNLFFQIDDYIESKKKQVSPKMINVYLNMKDTLKAFETFRSKSITFGTFDFNFYEEFVEYMKYEHIQRRRKEVIKGFRISTIGKTIKQLRIFLRNRMRKKIIPHINLEDFKILDEETDAIYLTWDEISLIYIADLSSYPHLCKYRDLLVFGCLTGLRFSDFSNIHSEDVRNGMLHKKQEKSDHWVVIPLREEAQYIFTMKFNGHVPLITNADFNYYIKEVGKLAGINQLIKFSHKKCNQDIITVKPKHAWITSHTCRRSFCTNEFLAGTPADLIMKISGHKSFRDFYKYIRISQEEAGQKIKELWQQRGAMTLLRPKEPKRVKEYI
jgi:Phage integrase SAM-like domain/Phage integrase family/Arm DNA-binding domain